MLQRLIFCLFILVIPFALIEAQEPSVPNVNLPEKKEQFVDKSLSAATLQLDLLLNRYTTYSAQYQQKTFDEKNQLLQQNGGTVCLQRPGKFRWESQTPTHQIIIADGQALWIYDVDLAQVTKQLLSQRRGASDPAALLTGNVAQLLQQFNVVAKPTKQDKVFVLTPKNAKSIFVQVELQFQNNQLTGLRVKNSLGQTSQFRFTDVKLNVKLDAALFQFTPPAGVDVLK